MWTMEFVTNQSNPKQISPLFLDRSLAPTDGSFTLILGRPARLLRSRGTF